jgi:transposase
MSQETLFPLPKGQEIPPRPATRPEEARVVRPVRNQAEIMVRDLDSLVAEDHPVRDIWAFLEQLDLTAFYAPIKAVVDRPGRPPSDPQVLLALWVYATVDGVGSARRLDRLCHEHDVYRWLCGNVPVDYHLLSDFRVAHQGALNKLLTEIVAAMMTQNLVKLNQVAQDGVKVRASAGAGSFRRRDRLERCLEEAEVQVKRLAAEREHPDPEVSQRQQAARQRVAEERAERVKQALGQLPEVQATKERQEYTLSKAKKEKITEPRVSTTDPEARVMKMADGGFRPAYNVQLSTAVDSRVIVGVGVVNQGNDAGQAVPLEDQVAQRTQRHPDDYLVDGGYAQRETITTLTERGITVYAPVRPPRTTTSGRQPHTPRLDDTPAVVTWRERMETDEAKAVYRQRGATAEWANAQARSHGLVPFTVRGLGKVLSVVLLVVIAHDLLRWAAMVR